MVLGSCAVCNRTVGLNKVYGDLEFCPEHSQKDFEEMQNAKKDEETVATQATDVTTKKDAKTIAKQAQFSDD